MSKAVDRMAHTAGWFEDLSPEAKKEYIKTHPTSKYAKGAKGGAAKPAAKPAAKKAPEKPAAKKHTPKTPKTATDKLPPRGADPKLDKVRDQLKEVIDANKKDILQYRSLIKESNTAKGKRAEQIELLLDELEVKPGVKKALDLTDKKRKLEQEVGEKLAKDAAKKKPAEKPAAKPAAKEAPKAPAKKTDGPGGAIKMDRNGKPPAAPKRPAQRSEEAKKRYQAVAEDVAHAFAKLPKQAKDVKPADRETMAKELVKYADALYNAHADNPLHKVIEGRSDKNSYDHNETAAKVNIKDLVKRLGLGMPGLKAYNAMAGSVEGYQKLAKLVNKYLDALPKH
jgi:hypothetical protein